MSEKRRLEGEISRLVTGGPDPDSDVSFEELIRRDDPAVMDAAEDLLRRRGWKLRGVTGALHARNFTIALKPLWGPRDEWKMVQTNVARPDGVRAKPDQVWVKMTVANGRVRVTRERKFKGDIDDARKVAVANAWAVARIIKGLPLDTDPKTIEKIVDGQFARRSKNAKIQDIL
jgi:hypothetical protein